MVRISNGDIEFLATLLNDPSNDVLTASFTPNAPGSGADQFGEFALVEPVPEPVSAALHAAGIAALLGLTWLVRLRGRWLRAAGLVLVILIGYCAAASATDMNQLLLQLDDDDFDVRDGAERALVAAFTNGDLTAAQIAQIQVAAANPLNPPEERDRAGEVFATIIGTLPAGQQLLSGFDVAIDGSLGTWEFFDLLKGITTPGTITG
jgi:hypothetical protein